jgi:hypothetical protein
VCARAKWGWTLLSWFFLTYVVGLTNVNLHCHAPVLFSITGILPHLSRLAVVVSTGPLLSLARSLRWWYYRIIVERPIGCPPLSVSCPPRASLMRDVNSNKAHLEDTLQDVKLAKLVRRPATTLQEIQSTQVFFLWVGGTFTPGKFLEDFIFPLVHPFFPKTCYRIERFCFPIEFLGNTHFKSWGFFHKANYRIQSFFFPLLGGSSTILILQVGDFSIRLVPQFERFLFFPLLGFLRQYLFQKSWRFFHKSHFTIFWEKVFS